MIPSLLRICFKVDRKVKRNEVCKRREGVGGKEVMGSQKEVSGGDGRLRGNMKESLVASVSTSPCHFCLAQRLCLSVCTYACLHACAALQQLNRGYFI